MKKVLGAIVVVAIVAAGIFYYIKSMPQSTGVPPIPTSTSTDTQIATSTPQPAVATSTVIGKSVQGRDIVAYNYGTGDTKILFVGGIHGGYEWNTVLVAYQLMDYLAANPGAIPTGVEVTVIPVLNPDGLNKVVGTAGRFTAADVPSSQATQISGRYNADTVDLNRNFDCEWKAKGVWQNTTVSGGTAPFSEPESQAMKQFVQSYAPTAAIVFYSSAGGVFSSDCHDVLPETKVLTDLYASASGYPPHDVFDYYAITGDMVNWLASQKIPAISVLLTNHTDTEWDKNLAGIQAVLAHYSNQSATQ